MNEIKVRRANAKIEENMPSDCVGDDLPRLEPKVGVEMRLNTTKMRRQVSGGAN